METQVIQLALGGKGHGHWCCYVGLGLWICGEWGLHLSFTGEKSEPVVVKVKSCHLFSGCGPGMLRTKPATF